MGFHIVKVPADMMVGGNIDLLEREFSESILRACVGKYNKGDDIFLYVHVYQTGTPNTLKEGLLITNLWGEVCFFFPSLLLLL